MVELTWKKPVHVESLKTDRFARRFDYLQWSQHLAEAYIELGESPTLLNQLAQNFPTFLRGQIVVSQVQNSEVLGAQDRYEDLLQLLGLKLVE